MRHFALALATSVLLSSVSASAHFTLLAPPQPKPTTEGGKGDPPCGPDTAEGTVTPVMGGSQLMLQISETVRHGGFYRVALATKDCHTKGCFPADNKVYDSSGMALNPTGPGTSDHADTDKMPVFPVLADNLFPHEQSGTPSMPMWNGMVPIPNMTCDKCTLQVIEFMTPHGPNGNAGYFYHHCADLKITADTSKPVFDPNGSMGSGGSGAGGAAGMAGAAGAAAASAGGAAGSSSGGETSGGSATTGSAGTSVVSPSAGAGGGSGGAPPSSSSGAPSVTAGTASGVSTSGSTSAAGSTADNGAASSGSDGGCSFSGHRAGASLLALLGLALAWARRRRTN